MNIVFWLIVLVILAGLWACLCYAFPAIGHKLFKIKDAVKLNIDETESEKENKNA